MRKVLFIASTGGHLNELMQLKPMFDKYDYHIITEKNKMTAGLKKEYGEKINFSDDIKILCKKTSNCSEAISKTKNLLDDTSFYSSCN